MYKKRQIKVFFNQPKTKHKSFLNKKICLTPKLCDKLKPNVFLILILICSFLPHHSLANSDVVLNVEMGNGKITEFLLSSKPTIAFTENEMVVNSSNGIFSYPRLQINRWYFTSTNVGISVSLYDKISLKLTDRILQIYGVVGIIKVFDIKGVELHPVVTQNTDYVSIDFSDIQESVYIITIPNHTTLKIKI